MNQTLIQTLSMSLIITSVAAMELRNLRASTVAYALQALLVVSLLLSFAAINPALYWWAATAMLTKAILIPWALWRATKQGDKNELKPIIGFGPSVVFAVLLMMGFFRLTHKYINLFILTGAAGQEILQTNLAVAATVFVLGLFGVLTRRDAIKTVIGLCLLENGVHLSLVSLAPELPETALFGVATEVVITVFLLLYVISGVRNKFGTTDTFKLKELQW